MISHLLFVGLLLLSSTTETKVLPKYISKCSIKNLDEFSSCVLKNAKNVVPMIINGDKNYKIPNLNPLFLEIIELNSGPSLNLTLFNETVTGLPTVDLKSVKFDKNTKELVIDLILDYLRLDGYYSIDGKILILPIVGKGGGFIDFRKPQISLSCILSTTKSKNGEVIKVENPSLKTDFEKVLFYMNNLFDGNKVLGDEMNKFLNDNWKEVIAEFQELVKAPISSVFTRVVSAFLNDLTYDAAFDGV